MQNDPEKLQAEIQRLSQRIAELEQSQEHARQQQTIQNNEANAYNLRAIIEHLADAIIVDCDGVVQFVNPSAEKLFGRSASELIGSQLGIPVPQDCRAEVEIHPPTNSPLTVEFQATTIEWNRKPSFLLSFRDITHRKQHQVQLEQHVGEQTALLQQAIERLLHELTRRDRVEKTLRNRDGIFEAMAHAADLFLKNLDLSYNIQTTLEKLGRATGVSRVYVFANVSNEQGKIVAEQQYGWVRETLAPQNKAEKQSFCYADSGLTGWSEKLAAGETICGNTRDFSEQEMHVLQQKSIVSILIVPIFTNQQWYGFLGFDDCMQEREWSPGEIDAIKTAAGIIGSAIQRYITQKALDVSASEFRKLYRAVEQSPVSIAITDTNGVIEYINPRFTQTTGYSFAESVGKTHSFLQSGQTQSEEYEEMWQALLSGQEWQGVLQNKKSNGELYWASLSISPITNALGRITHFVAITEDITEQKWAEETLRNSELRFRMVADFTYAWEYWVSANGSYLYMSPSCERITGYRPEAFISQPQLMEEIMHPEDLERMQKHFRDELTRAEAMSTSFRIITRSGAVEWIGHVCQPVYAQGGQWVGRRASNREITRRVQMEEALRQSEEHYRMLAENIPDIIYRFRIRPTRYYEYISPSATTITGYTPDEFYADPDLHYKMVHPDSRSLLENVRQSPSAQPKPLVLRAIRKDGKEIWLEHRHWLVFDEEMPGTPPVAIEGIIGDITERKLAEERLLQHRQALSMLQERERLARELHDNLGQVLGYMNTQAQSIRDLFSRGFTSTAITSLSHMIDVVQNAHKDVREFILGTKTGMQMHIQPQDSSSEVFFSTLKEYVQLLDQLYHLKVTIHAPDDLHDELFDPLLKVQLLRIVQEALTNIRKHAGVNSADIFFEFSNQVNGKPVYEANDRDKQWLRVIIADHGCGFSLDAQEDSTTEHLSLSGYGLYSMRGRTEDIGGTLTVETAPDAGTQVIVQIPLHVADKPEWRTLRILLADDSPIFLQGMQNLLVTYGFDVIGTAENGLEAANRARELKPDIILMDINMPHYNGLQATRTIKQEMPDIPIVMLTMSEDNTDLFEAIKSGAAGYLLKDMDAEEMFDMLQGAAKGEVVIQPSLAMKVLQEFASQTDEDEAYQEAEMVVSQRPQGLEDHEFEVLKLVSRGLTYRQTGEQLGYSERTIKRYMGDIMKRLHLRSRAEVISYAQRIGLSEQE